MRIRDVNPSWTWLNAKDSQKQDQIKKKKNTLADKKGWEKVFITVRTCLHPWLDRRQPTGYWTMTGSKISKKKSQQGNDVGKIRLKRITRLSVWQVLDDNNETWTKQKGTCRRIDWTRWPIWVWRIVKRWATCSHDSPNVDVTCLTLSNRLFSMVSWSQTLSVWNITSIKTVTIPIFKAISLFSLPQYRYWSNLLVERCSSDVAIGTSRLHRHTLSLCYWLTLGNDVMRLVNWKRPQGKKRANRKMKRKAKDKWRKLGFSGRKEHGRGRRSEKRLSRLFRFSRRLCLKSRVSLLLTRYSIWLFAHLEGSMERKEKRKSEQRA